jgi:hypothetical protein
MAPETTGSVSGARVRALVETRGERESEEVKS